MTEQKLDHSQIGPSLEQVHSKSGTQSVGADGLGDDTGGPCRSSRRPDGLWVDVPVGIAAGEEPLPGPESFPGTTGLAGAADG